MLNWMKRRRTIAASQRDTDTETKQAQGRAKLGKYLLLYDYLDARYASKIVLTFAEIEDLLGFALPAQARLQQEWWTKTGIDAAGYNHSDCWTLAKRTATPNLMAQIVLFERPA